MSHFTVMVFGEDPEGQLAPYYENLEDVQDPKWDYHGLGGRWSGFFKAKNVTSLTDPPNREYVDSLTKDNIDLEGMKEEWLRDHSKQYDEITGIINTWTWINRNTMTNIRRTPLPWSFFRSLIDSGKFTRDEARETYRSTQTFNSDLSDAGYHFWSEDPIDDYWSKTKEEYLTKSVRDVMLPYAFVKDGEWFGRGEMGWFGASIDEIDEDEYYNSFWDVFNSLSGDTLVSLYDCHI